MSNNTFLRDVSAISLGVIISMILTSPKTLYLPSYMWYVGSVWNQRKRHLLTYKSFYGDICMRPSTKNVLLLCHGREHGVPVFDFRTGEKLLLENYNIATIDVNPDVKPHIISDVCNLSIYDFFLPEVFDYIILFNCRCHTYDINTNRELAPRLRLLLKSQGELIIQLQHAH